MRVNRRHLLAEDHNVAIVLQRLAVGLFLYLIRSVQRFTLGFDHRIVDGADAGKFMTDFKSYLQDWTEDIG